MSAFSRRLSSQPHVQFSLRCELDIKSTRARVLTCIGACKVAEVLFNCSMYRHVCVVPRSSNRVTIGRAIIMHAVPGYRQLFEFPFSAELWPFVHNNSCQYTNRPWHFQVCRRSITTAFFLVEGYAYSGSGHSAGFSVWSV